MTTFMEAWQRTVLIDGWLTEVEAELLFSVAKSIGGKRRIVEIGTYRGRSTSLLAQTDHEIVTIDPLDGDHHPDNLMRVLPDHDVPELERTLARYNNVKWLRQPSYEFANGNTPVAMLYIDGSHVHPNPLRDFRHMRKWLVVGSYVCFHDYGAFKDVTDTVNFLVDSGQLERVEVKNKLFVARIPELQPTEVTGFSLFVLCHNFERRFSKFMESLVNQHCQLPIHVHLFHAKDDLIPKLDAEGINYSSYKVPVEQIMNRAELFSLTFPKKQILSHVVYTDSDLWFPPGFFSQYADELGKRKPGYWSAFLRDIPEDDAEMLLDVNSLTEDTLQKYSAPGFRYDHGRGTAGHFQCVPKSLASYPPSRIHGVGQADWEFSEWAIAQSADLRPERRLDSCVGYHFGHPYSWQGTEVPL